MSEMPVKHFRTKSKVDGNILISKENKQIVTAHGGSVCGNDLNAVPDRPQPVYLWADENDGIRRNLSHIYTRDGRWISGQTDCPALTALHPCAHMLPPLIKNNEEPMKMF